MEAWKDETMNSTRGMTRAKAPADCFDRIQKKIIDSNGLNKSNKTWIGVAAAVLIMIGANAVLLIDKSADSTFSNNEIDYPSLMTSLNIYDHE